MGIEKLKRVIWRLREMKTDEPEVYNEKQVRLAIMEECGTDRRTISDNMIRLKELNLLESAGIGKLKIVKLKIDTG